MKLIKQVNIAIFLNTALLGWVVAAGSHSGGHEENQSGHHGDNKTQGSHDDINGGHQGGSHAHSTWEKPPANYAKKNWLAWSDQQIAKRGKQLYTQQCASCHGSEGKGDGVVGKSLAHPPADLSNHFHKSAGNGDAYLFWRISEGGMVEPFRSMKSAMPAYKSTLSEADRWAILTYVHQQFHGGFTETKSH